MIDTNERSAQTHKNSVAELGICIEVAMFNLRIDIQKFFAA